ncbi:hypothetical protein Rxycam_02712 [Rubrobacter xylanophilus DSM 9941]|nr:hypothetical protein Rxycam_02712 [Rubrobacter xylanophilus DSM 9941]
MLCFPKLLAAWMYTHLEETKGKERWTLRFVR